MIKISKCSDVALVAASNATDAGSPFGLPTTTGVPIRSPQVLNCSTAAALKVSAAANKTFLPSPLKSLAILATEVVFPVPFTPTTRIVVTPAGFNSIDLAPCESEPSIFSVTFSSSTSARSLSTSLIISSVNSAPISDSIRTRRNSSISAGVALFRENLAKKEPNRPI